MRSHSLGYSHTRYDDDGDDVDDVSVSTTANTIKQTNASTPGAASYFFDLRILLLYSCDCYIAALFLHPAAASLAIVLNLAGLAL